MASQPRADGVQEAVRRVRLAAASLSGPLDVLTVATTAAQALPDVLDPALEKLAPSPFAGLEGLLGGVTQQAGAGPAAGGSARRAPASSTRPAPPRPSLATPTGIAGVANDAVAVLGRFVTDELNALAVQAAPSLVGTAVQTQIDTITRSFTGAPPDPTVAAALQPVEDLLTATGLQPATPSRRAGAATAVTARNAGLPEPAVEGARAAATAVAEGVQLLEELTGTAPPRQPAATTPSGALTPAAPTDPLGGLLGSMAQAFAGAGAPVTPKRGRPPAGAAGAETGQGAQPTPPAQTQTAADGTLVSTLEQERRKLLDVVAAVERAAAASSQPAAPSADDRDDVAWLVNEALVEQARLHGMDLR